ncbi:caspase-8 [Aulostomus maculatus]
MDRLKLVLIDEELDSSEVAALCFLCRDVVNRKRLEGISDAKQLFTRLEERGLLENAVFLSQLLFTIRRADLLRQLEMDSRQLEETDAHPVLPGYRVMLYHIYEDVTQENLEKIKFVLSDKLGRRQTEMCNTVLDVFAEMEKMGLLSESRLDELLKVLVEIDQQLAQRVECYKEGGTQQQPSRFSSHVSMDNQRVNNTPASSGAILSISETSPSYEGEHVYIDANTESASLHNQAEYYALSHYPRGVCMILNNEFFCGSQLGKRGGTQEDEKALRSVFSQFGFTVVVRNNLTAVAMKQELKTLSKRNFSDDDALVVCVLSHGEIGCVFGSDGIQVLIRELTQPFTSERAPTLAGKPKLFFIQACQGSGYQKGSMLNQPQPRVELEEGLSLLDVDAGPFHGETVPSDADFLLGMATVPECKSFRHTSTGSIYIQELCRQLRRSAGSSNEDDILTVLTRVNREVSKGEYLAYKQMPEPKYTLTKKLVLRFVTADQDPS